MLTVLLYPTTTKVDSGGVCVCVCVCEGSGCWLSKEYDHDPQYCILITTRVIMYKACRSPKYSGVMIQIVYYVLAFCIT